MSKKFYEKFLKKFYPGYRYSWEIHSERLIELRGKNKSWLDAGCGRNKTVGEYPARFAVGCDLGIHPKLENRNRFVKGRIENLPFGYSTFDFITAHYVLEHLAEPKKAFKEFARILEPGGYLLIRTTNRLNYAFFLASLLPQRTKKLLIGSFYGESVDVYPTWYRINTPMVLQRVGREAGLVLEDMIMNESLHFVHPILFLISFVIERIFSIGPFKNLKNTMVVVYKKPAPGTIV